jgi:pimeloyl-ACP methyl ester carboxylesterase
MLRRRATFGLAMGSLSAVAGCGVFFRPSNIKMDVFYDDRACAKTQAPVLLVLLPGANMEISELQREGFVAAVRRQNLAVDVAIADANLNYVFDGSMLKRMREDVVGAARAQGYQRIWLAGISLGGFVALGYALKNPGEIEGLMLMAPYLGRRQVMQDIVQAGGPAAWRQTAKPRQADDIDHDLWMWLSGPRTQAPPIWLGYGREDRFAPSHALMATLLPSDRVQVVPGGHDWPPWRTLWQDWLQDGPLRQGLACSFGPAPKA